MNTRNHPYQNIRLKVSYVNHSFSLENDVKNRCRIINISEKLFRAASEKTFLFSGQKITLQRA